MAQCTVSGVIKDVSDTAIAGVVVKANIVTPFFVTTIHILPKEISDTSDSNGLWDLSLTQGCSAIVTMDFPGNSTDSAKKVTYAITVPSAATADFSTLATEL